MKPLLLFQKLLPRFRRWPRAARHQHAPVPDEPRAVPVWIGSQISAYPLVVQKRARSHAQFYDEWE